ncbi:MAG TPA: pyridoxal phosphate-dependent aminotransferase, partial [Hellea balneolensis]|nr:pyridoxal phosphate-dependent aminotransferase [Hellea balneolensis]
MCRMFSSLQCRDLMRQEFGQSMATLGKQYDFSARLLTNLRGTDLILTYSRAGLIPSKGLICHANLLLWGMDKFARRLTLMQPSATLAITQAARDMREQGRDVLMLSAGEPDFETPKHIKQAAIQAIRDGQTRYTPVDGITPLKQAIADKFARDNSLNYDLDEITVAPGGKAVIFNALLATLNPGDEVIIPTPCWVSYPEIVRFCEARPVLLACPQDQGYKLRPEQLAAAITDRTRWLILNSPGNPTGAVYSGSELQGLGEVLARHPHVMVLSDDIYEHVRYDGRGFATMAAACPDLRSRCLTMNGVSKAYAMTGWRIGYGAGPKGLIRAMARIMAQSTTNPASISQWAALAAIDGPQDFLEGWRAEWQARRDQAFADLEKVEGLRLSLPSGAFYLFVDCRNLLGRKSAAGCLPGDDIAFCQALLEECGVAVVPGSAFHAPGHFRL